MLRKHLLFTPLILAIGFMAISSASISAAEEKPVKASQYGFDKNDATAALQKAIDSGAKKLIVDNTGSPWIIGPIKLVSNQEIIFEDGVIVQAKKGLFKQLNDCLFLAGGKENIILCGEGKVILKMNKKDYQDLKVYKHSEWRHTISLMSTKNVTIKNLVIESSGGDGLYLGAGGKQNGCLDTVVENCEFLDHHRQGISIISAENFIAKNCKFNNTSGTPPACGLDFEPNTPKEYLVNCILENCEFNNNDMAGAFAHLVNLTDESRPVSISFRNCSFINNLNGVGACANMPGRGKGLKGEMNFVNCIIEGAKEMPVYFSSLEENSVKITFKNCVIKDKVSAKTPVISLSSNSPEDFGNLDFGNLFIESDRNIMAFTSMTGSGLVKMNGDITVKTTDGKTSKFDLASFIKNHKPDQALKAFKVSELQVTKYIPNSLQKVSKGENIKYRGNLKFVQYAKGGTDTIISFNGLKVAKHPVDISVTVKDQAGTLIKKFNVKEEEYKYTLNPPGDGVYTLEVSTGSHAVNVKSSAPGFAAAADQRIGLFRTRTQWYFQVPAGQKEINVEVVGEVGEPVSAELIAPDGKLVSKEFPFSGMKILSYQRENNAKSEVWSLKLDGLEDHSFRLGQGITPLASASTEDLLIVK